MAFTIKSSAFKDGELMSEKYTCKGEDLSPPLAWSEVPQQTKSFAIICDDPDAPFVTWVHWVIYDIPADVTQLPEGIPTKETLPNGAKQGKNDFRKIGYGGPCPPPGGPHRYLFKLYALDKILELEPGLTKKEILAAMEGHILGKTTLIGKFKR
ncbi:MAG: YbhB/YbcL family Raf kinase inhibitor-like protein [Candidatus Omnitrophica bacterium]|nr:YbhB/YbcL family Raf kinase inhibitor-like protein [Candidatus Omnitrophota bacterium]